LIHRIVSAVAFSLIQPNLDATVRSSNNATWKRPTKRDILYADVEKNEEGSMKRIILVVAFVAILASPVFSQLRIDIGVDVPMNIYAVGGGQVQSSSDVGQFLKEHIFPFPEAGLYYQFSAGPIKLAPGVRVFTFILESVLWPNLMMEIALDPVFIQAQVGGLLFVFFGLANDAQYGQVFLPDLSIWLGLGKQRRFRLGGGLLGMYLPELTTEGMAVVPYLGGKIALEF
jgi:hypothetical protein